MRQLFNRSIELPVGELVVFGDIFRRHNLAGFAQAKQLHAHGGSTAPRLRDGVHAQTWRNASQFARSRLSNRAFARTRTHSAIKSALFGFNGLLFGQHSSVVLLIAGAALNLSHSVRTRFLRRRTARQKVRAEPVATDPPVGFGMTSDLVRSTPGGQSASCPSRRW
jgi:hypothetical protein